MMSSVDLTGISSPSNPSQGLNGPSSSYHGRSNEQIPSHHQPQYQQQQHYPHQQHHVRMPTAAQAASSSTGPAEAGRLKTEQVVVEFFFKVAELIVQSRVNLQHEDGGRSRRARFNLDIDEIQSVRDRLGVWKENVHLPLTLDIYWDPEEHSNTNAHQRTLLERWNILYTPSTSAEVNSRGSNFSSGSSSTSSNNNSSSNNRDVIQQLREVCKRISVLLRSLYAIMRTMPAHRLQREVFPSCMSYAIFGDTNSDSKPSIQFERDVAVSRYSFIPISTPFGFLKVTTMYRRDCERFFVQEEAPQSPIFQENFILQEDYVPNETPSSTKNGATAPITIAAIPPPRKSSLDHESNRSTGSQEVPTRVGSLPGRSSLSSHTQEFTHHNGSFGEMAMDERRWNGSSGRSSLKQVGTPTLSQPMAIPTMKTATSYEEKNKPNHVGGGGDQKLLHHAHSFGESERLRMNGGIENFTAAPYGYRNIENSPQGGGSGSGGMGRLSSGGGNGSGGGYSASYQDQHLAYSPHPLSTPPRHPNSLTPSSSLKNSRSGSYLRRSFFENRALEQSGEEERHSFDSGTPPFSYHPSVSHGSSSTSAQMKNCYSSSPSTDSLQPVMIRRAQTEGGEKAGISTTPPPAAPVFSSSPPFLANPCELLSTSPGYSFSRGGNRRLKDMNTSSSQSSNSNSNSNSISNSGEGDSVGGNSMGAKEFLTFSSKNAKSNRGSSSFSPSAKTRTFSADYNASSNIWGVSPDTPENFSFSIGGGRNRLYSSSDGVGGVQNGVVVAAAAGIVEGMESSTAVSSQFGEEMVMLPFAINEAISTSTSTTLTTISMNNKNKSSPGSTTAKMGGSRRHSFEATASLGSFLQQLKQAPRLQIFTGENSSATTTTMRSSSSKSIAMITNGMTGMELQGTQEKKNEEDQREARNNDGNNGGAGSRSVASVGFYEDELENFRMLRDQLMQGI